jgi:hypothetical protein
MKRATILVVRKDLEVEDHEEDGGDEYDDGGESPDPTARKTTAIGELFDLCLLPSVVIRSYFTVKRKCHAYENLLCCHLRIASDSAARVAHSIGTADQKHRMW